MQLLASNRIRYDKLIKIQALRERALGNITATNKNNKTKLKVKAVLCSAHLHQNI